MSSEELKQKVIKYYEENKDNGKSYTVKYFKKKGETEETILEYINAVDKNGNTPKRKPFGDFTNSGRVVKKGTIGKSAITLQSFPTDQLGAQVSPFSNKGDKLLDSCRRKCEAIAAQFKGHDWVMDHKCTLSFKHNLKYKHIITFVGDTRPFYINQEDLVPRLTVWIAFSNKGISEPYVYPCDQKFDKDIYLDECVKKRLIPFMQRNHDLSKTVLWSDGTPPNNNKKVLEYLREENIKFVDPADNPGNRVRCCSYFWSMLKNETYFNDWIAVDEEDLRQKVLKGLESIRMNNLKRLLDDTEKRINEMAQFGEIKTNDDKEKYTCDDHLTRLILNMLK